MHIIRTVVCAAALLCAAPPLYAQCSWEHDTPRGRREAQEDSVYKAVRQAQLGALRGAVRAANASDPKGLVVVTVGRGGAAPVIRAYDANFPAAALDGAARVLTERLREVPVRGYDRLGTVLRLDTVPLPPARADGRRRECRPVLINRQLVVDELQRWAASNIEAERILLPALVGLAISRDGRVVYTEIVRTSGLDALDRIALDIASRLQFRPATVDGVPRDVWSAMPVGTR